MFKAVRVTMKHKNRTTQANECILRSIFCPMGRKVSVKAAGLKVIPCSGPYPFVRYEMPCETPLLFSVGINKTSRAVKGKLFVVANLPEQSDTVGKHIIERYKLY